MITRPFDYDPETGITETFHYDEITDTAYIETTQVLDLDELNAAEYAAHSDHGPTRWKGDFHRVASIPLVALQHLQQIGAISPEGWVRDEKALIKILNDRDYLKLRTMPGRL